MDYRAGSRTGKLASYHMFIFTGQVCTSNCVFTVGCFSLHYFLTGAPPATPVCAHLLRVLHCVHGLLIVMYFHRVCVWMSVCVCLINSLKVWLLKYYELSSLPVVFHLTVVLVHFYFHHGSLSFYFHPTNSVQCIALQDWTCFTYTVPSPVVNVDIIVPIMTFVLYVCQRMVCTVMYASRQ